MGSQGGSVRSSGSTMEELSLRSLSRQGSLYSLTLDEVQNQLGGLGKPLGSMNLDELLKSVWSVEASNGPNLDSLAMNPGHSLQRQPSFTLSRDLSKKTVEEVWKDIQHGNNKRGNDGESQHQNHEGGDQERQPTLGEMTLEDFLVKAGVVAESPLLNNPSAVLGVGSQQNIAQHAQWMHYQLPSVQNQQPQKVMTVFMPGHPTVQQPVPLGAPSILDVAYPEAQMTASPSSLMGTLSDTQTPGRKRVAPEDVVEKTVERRQKRMIKNRESAARSRARKQAYTHELENKVSRLEEENERLRRQREVEKVLPCAPPPEPKNRLRRTSSAPL